MAAGPVLLAKLLSDTSVHATQTITDWILLRQYEIPATLIENMSIQHITNERTNENC